MASIKYTYHRNLLMFRASGIWCSKNRTLLLILVTLNISMFLLMNYINQYYFNIFTILKYKYSWKFMNYDEKWILPVFKRNFRKTLIFDERVGGIFFCVGGFWSLSIYLSYDIHIVMIHHVWHLLEANVPKIEHWFFWKFYATLWTFFTLASSIWW